MRDLVGRPDVRLVGVHSGGVWLAERLREELGVQPRSACSTSRSIATTSAAAASSRTSSRRRSRFDVDGRAHPAGRRRAVHRPHRARGDERDCSTTAGRRASTSRCSSIAAAANCRWRRRSSARRSRCRRRRERRAVARRRRRAAPDAGEARVDGVTIARNPQLNRNGELQHLLSIEGLPRPIVERILATADSFINVAEREVKNVPLLRGKSGLQPVLREQHAHAHDLRDRRAAPVGRRVQPEHHALEHRQGRVAARHDQQPDGDAGRHVRGAPRGERRAVPDRPALRAARARDQRRRRPPRAPDAGPARHVHDPPLQEGLHQADRGDRRRHPALARGALRHPRADHARRARSARDRPADAAARRARADGRHGVHHARRRHPRRRRDHHAAAAERTHERRAAAVGAGVLRALRPDAGAAARSPSPMRS